MRIKNKPSALQVFLSRANEHERRAGYASRAARLRGLMRLNAGRMNANGMWLMHLAITACEREARS